MNFGQAGHPLAAIGLFGGAIALASLGLLPVAAALGFAAVAMVVGNILPLRELYGSVDWSVIVLLGAMIPVGGASEATGTSALIADWILAVTAG